jgi:hypothetical protein
VAEASRARWLRIQTLCREAAPAAPVGVTEEEADLDEDDSEAEEPGADGSSE